VLHVHVHSNVVNCGGHLLLVAGRLSSVAQSARQREGCIST